jgi:hypothetical protein
MAANPVVPNGSCNSAKRRNPRKLGPRNEPADCALQLAEENRKRRGEGKPETFDFLGFMHISGKNRSASV